MCVSFKSLSYIEFRLSSCLNEIVLLQWCQKWDADMATQLDLPLPEISVENFSRAWTQFELVAAAKQWEDAKQVTILPTLLRGKLIDYYVELDMGQKGSVKSLRMALMTKAGLLQDPLTAGRAFSERRQGLQERVADYFTSLRRLFAQAYPEEKVTSSVLLQQFLTGLCAPVRQQVLLKGKPGSLEEAITEATQVEYALSFETLTRHTPGDVNAVHQHQEPCHTPEGRSKQPEPGWKDLCQTLEKMSARLEALEKGLQQAKTDAYFNVAVKNPRRYRGESR